MNQDDYKLIIDRIETLERLIERWQSEQQQLIEQLKKEQLKSRREHRWSERLLAAISVFIIVLILGVLQSLGVWVMPDGVMNVLGFAGAVLTGGTALKAFQETSKD